MSPVIRQVLRERRWYIFWWTLGVIAFIGINVSVYPSIRDQTAELNKSFAGLSDSVKMLFSDTGEFFSPAGYLSSQIFYLMLPLLLSILGIGLGSSLIGREEQAGTLELLLARPISRGRLLAAKALGGLAIVLGIGAVATLSSLALCGLVDIDVSLSGVAFAGLEATLLGLLFGSIAFALTALGRTGRLASVGIATLAALGAYLISSLEGLANWLEWPAKLLPYHYYHPAEALEGNGYEWGFVLGLVMSVLVLTSVAYVGFRRRDIG